MPDLIDELAVLHHGRPAPVADDVVAADIGRGRRALHRRRLRRGAATGLSAGVVALVAGLAFGIGADTDTGRGPTVADGTTSAPITPGAPAVVGLVAWTGPQLPGFTVAYVPEGFVLQGVSDAVLDVARPDDTTALDSFVGKLVVMLDDHATPLQPGGTAVTVGGRPGWYRQGDGATTLYYGDGSHHVVVQAWDGLGLTPTQLVRFAEGVTVTADAVPGHG